MSSEDTTPSGLSAFGDLPEIESLELEPESLDALLVWVNNQQDFPQTYGGNPGLEGLFALPIHTSTPVSASPMSSDECSSAFMQCGQIIPDTPEVYNRPALGAARRLSFSETEDDQPPETPPRVEGGCLPPPLKRRLQWEEAFELRKRSLSMPSPLSPTTSPVTIDLVTPPCSPSAVLPWSPVSEGFITALERAELANDATAYSAPPAHTEGSKVRAEWDSNPIPPATQCESSRSSGGQCNEEFAVISTEPTTSAESGAAPAPDSGVNCVEGGISIDDLDFETAAIQCYDMLTLHGLIPSKTALSEQGRVRSAGKRKAPSNPPAPHRMKRRPPPQAPPQARCLEYPADRLARCRRICKDRCSNCCECRTCCQGCVRCVLRGGCGEEEEDEEDYIFTCPRQRSRLRRPESDDEDDTNRPGPSGMSGGGGNAPGSGGSGGSAPDGGGSAPDGGGNAPDDGGDAQGDGGDAPDDAVNAPVDTFDFSSWDGNNTHDGFTIIDMEQRYYKKFKSLYRDIVFRIDEVPEDTDPESWYEGVFNRLVAFVSANTPEHYRVGLEITSIACPDKPIGITYRRVNQLSGEVILRKVFAVAQSNADFLTSGPLTARFGYTAIPIGKGETTKSWAAYVNDKHSLITMANKDTLCLARAIVISKANADGNKKLFNKLIKCRKTFQKDAAMRLCEEAGVDLSEGGGLEHIRQFQRHLNDYTITVYTERDGSDVMFKGELSTLENPRTNIDLIFQDEHYTPITNLAPAFNFKFYCRPCMKGYHKPLGHRCPGVCSKCWAVGCSTLTADRNVFTTIKCADCNCKFTDQVCFDNHLRKTFLSKKKKSICDLQKSCDNCNASYRIDGVKNRHKCDVQFCKTCAKNTPKLNGVHHQCYMPPSQPPKNEKKILYIFFDLECTQTKTLNGREDCKEHTPNLCITQQACKVCFDVEGDFCHQCGIRQREFSGENTIADFIDFVTLKRPNFKKVVVIAHNFRGYDGQFILRHMAEVKQWRPSIMMRQKNILSIKIDEFQFIDSLNFFQMGLGKLPSMLGLTVKEKGYFPHLFNKEENFDYVGALPDASFYAPDTMSVSDRNKFMLWHQEEAARICVEGTFFDFKQEIRKYCSNDVTILRQACLKFRKDFLEANGVDPFGECITIASACMLSFRRKYLEEDLIGVIPPGGYRLADRQSHTAIMWLEWEAHQRGVTIAHAHNGRESIVHQRKVDGYYVDEAGTKVVLEFNGCFFHGCLVCFPNQDGRIYPHSDETMGLRYRNTASKKAHLERNGCRVISMWGCEFEKLKRITPELQSFLKTHHLANEEPLCLRDAFCGGRTNCIRLYHAVNDDAGEVIRYLDVCSLYPWCNKYGKYPVYHPTLYVALRCAELVGYGPAFDLDNVEGFVKCTVLPPQTLFHPVLPMKMDKKLMFVLCRRCAEELSQVECMHVPRDRELTGVWVADELRKAVEMGYLITRVYEIYQYTVVQYDPQTKTGGVYVRYINAFLKIKQEASGWPAWCKTREDEDEYLCQFLHREGIALDRHNVQVNSGMRAVGKNCLNSFWGKFGQGDNLCQTELVSSHHQLVNFLTRPTIKVHSCLPVSENLMYVTYESREECLKPSPFTSVAHAAFTTALARLKLYTYLEALGQRVLYFDTDSVIFTQLPGEWCPPTGDFLGDLTDEIAGYGQGAMIETFVSGGPKSYALSIRKPDGGKAYVCKCKGLTPNFGNREKLNFDVLKSMVVNNAPANKIDYPHKIFKTGFCQVATRAERKVYRANVTKRRRVGKFDTLPFGYKS